MRCGERNRIVRPERDAGGDDAIRVDPIPRAQGRDDGARLLGMEQLVRQTLLGPGARNDRRGQRRSRHDPAGMVGRVSPDPQHALSPRARLRDRGGWSSVHREHERPFGARVVAARQLHEHRHARARGDVDDQLSDRKAVVHARRRRRVDGAAAPHRLLEIVKALAGQRHERSVRLQRRFSRAWIGIGCRPQITLHQPVQWIDGRRLRLRRGDTTQQRHQNDRVLH